MGTRYMLHYRMYNDEVFKYEAFDHFIPALWCLLKLRMDGMDMINFEYRRL